MQPDYLYPITDNKSRDEYILIEFKNILRNFNEVVINKMLTDINHWVDKYPLLQELIKNDYDTVYHLVSYCGISEVLYNAGEQKVSLCEIEQDIAKLLKTDIIEMSTRLQFQSALVQLLDKDFVKKVYIQCDEVTDEIRDFIRKEYFIFIPEKIHLIEGNLIDCYNEHSELTSIILDRADNLLTILQKNESVRGKSFILSDSKYNNHYLDNSNDSNEMLKYERKHAKVFDEAMENRCCFISYMHPFRIQTPDK